MHSVVVLDKRCGNMLSLRSHNGVRQPRSHVPTAVWRMQEASKGYASDLGATSCCVAPVPSSAHRTSGVPSTSGRHASLLRPLHVVATAVQPSQQLASAAPPRLHGPQIDALDFEFRLKGVSDWTSLKDVAVQVQDQLGQRGIVALLHRAEQMAVAGSYPGTTDQYACARLLEVASMAAAPLVATLAPATVSAMLGAFGTLATRGLLVKRFVPYMLVAVVQALVLASLSQLQQRGYSPSQMAAVLRGCALLSPGGLPEVWLQEWQAAARAPVLQRLAPAALAAVMSSVAMLRQRQNWAPSGAWLQECIEAANAKLLECSGHDLRQLMLGLASLEARPPSASAGAFRYALDEHVAKGMTPDDIAGVLFAFTKLDMAYA